MFLLPGRSLQDQSSEESREAEQWAAVRSSVAVATKQIKHMSSPARSQVIYLISVN
jgi:hypothetical protein